MCVILNYEYFKEIKKTIVCSNKNIKDRESLSMVLARLSIALRLIPYRSRHTVTQNCIIHITVSTNEYREEACTCLYHGLRSFWRLRGTTHAPYSVIKFSDLSVVLLVCFEVSVRCVMQSKLRARVMFVLPLFSCYLSYF